MIFLFGQNKFNDFIYNLFIILYSNINIFGI